MYISPDFLSSQPSLCMYTHTHTHLPSHKRIQSNFWLPARHCEVWEIVYGQWKVRTLFLEILPVTGRLDSHLISISISCKSFIRLRSHSCFTPCVHSGFLGTNFTWSFVSTTPWKLAHSSLVASDCHFLPFSALFCCPWELCCLAG